MPELPEVETVCRGIAPALIGRQLIKVECSDKPLRLPFPAHFIENITGKHVTQIERRAKYIVAFLEGDTALIIHLGMSGTLVIHENQNPPRKHDHMRITLDNGQNLVFNDPRRFGLVTLATRDTLSSHPLFARLGLEPFAKECTGAWLFAQCQNRKIPIKQLIMDGHILVGVGNIYASESLFRAHILPTRPAKDITKKEAEVLVASIQNVLQAAINAGGSTLKDYVRSNGDSGYFQHHFAVYDKAGKPCECGKGIIQRITQSGRSTYYCNSCQK